MRNDKITPLYERLSRDNELQGKSNSRSHQNYLRCKASGKQKEYEDRIKTGKRRQMEAKKAALPHRGHGKRRVLYRGQRTVAGAAEGCITDPNYRCRIKNIHHVK